MQNNAELKEVLSDILELTNLGSSRTFSWTFEFQSEDGRPWIRIPDTFNSFDDAAEAVMWHHEVFPWHNVKIVRL